jgi:hypothetical protein
MSPLTARHPDFELLSAYLDNEVDRIEARTVETHLEACDSCRAKLRDLRGVVYKMSALDRPAPPPWLITQVRREVVYKRQESFWLRLGRALLQLPLEAPVASALSVLLAVAFVFLLFTSPALSHGRQGLSSLATYPGPVDEPKPDPNFVLIETTSEVAGRKFVRQEDNDVWNFFLYQTAGQPAASGPERNVWVEQGLPANHLPLARIDARSPQGRALLARYSDLGYLLADGSRVRMRYQRETLELRSGA